MTALAHMGMNFEISTFGPKVLGPFNWYLKVHRHLVSCQDRVDDGRRRRGGSGKKKWEKMLSALFWRQRIQKYWCNYLHRSRDSGSPVCGIFLIYMLWKIVKYKQLSYCFSALQFRKRITSSFVLVLSLLIYCTLSYFILFALMAFCFCYTLLNTTATPFFSLIKLQCCTAVQLSLLHSVNSFPS